jgi:glycosyltransferase involved in cell wall biosynthesis
MRLGIDASNIRGGGGLTHLRQMLAAADPPAHGFEQVVVWAPQSTLEQLKNQPWLLKRHDRALESHYLLRAWWQSTRLGVLARHEGCDLLFVPGGPFATEFRPVVTMSRNLLPFEWRELRRYGCSSTTLRLLLLRGSLTRSFRRASGTIFLTRYAQQAVRAVAGTLPAASRIVPHGVDARFFQPEHAREVRPVGSLADPLRIIYVSIIDLYKHQWHVATAVARLRSEGHPVSLTLIGPAYRPAMRRLRATLTRLDPHGEFLRYAGPVSYAELPAYYAGADVCVFASSCENMPNILLEGMAAALPIASSNRSAMPEVLDSAGVYFDPEDANSIADALRELVSSPQLRLRQGRAAEERARLFSWTRCARDTFDFLASVAAGRNTTTLPISA